MVIGVLAFGVVDGSYWGSLLSPTLAYRPAVLFGLTLVFGWRGFAWSQLVLLTAFVSFQGWRGAVFVEPLYLLSHACGLVVARAIARGEVWLTGERSTLAFLTGALIAPALPALLSDPMLSALGIAHRPIIPSPVESWLRGGAGMMAIAPAVVMWSSSRLKDWVGFRTDRPYRLESSNSPNILALGLEVVVWIGTLLMAIHFKARYGLNVTYLSFLPPLIFILFQGMRLATLAIAANAVAATTLWSLLHWHDVLSAADLRLLIGLYSIIFLVLSVVVDDRWRGRKRVEQLVTTEAVLRENEKYFRTLANAAPVMIWATGRDKLCTFVNRGWLEFTGRSLDEELGNGWTESIHPDDREQAFETYTSSFDSRVKFEMEYRVRRSDAVYRWVADRGVPLISEAGAFTGYIGSCTDITDRKTAMEQLRGLSASLTAAQEEERRRISRELHDDLLQSLGLMAIDLGKLAQTQVAGTSLRGELRSLQKRASEAAELTRHLAHELHSLVLEDFGIATALRSLCEEFGRREGIRVEFISSELPLTPSRETAFCLYTITQEALQNVSKHARAKRVCVQLAHFDRSIGLSITDDGIGFAADEMPTLGLGILNMRERVRWVNGNFSVNSQPGGGAQVTVKVPIPS
jgi:PAS domain S-box-containing protein